jgi:hypothetical protein
MNILFTFFLGLVLFGCLGWGAHYLPGERWQFLAAVPLYKKKNGRWRSINFTFYGFFIATSQLLALILALCLLSSINVSLLGTTISIAILLFFCIPAARVMAIIVEKKRHTFTVGGASFVGIILAPWIILFTQYILGNFEPTLYLPVLPILSALSISYTMGEGLGRLACLSYGCCYGKPVDQATPFMQKIFSRVNTIFHGDNKKVAYESNLCGVPLIPIQVITGVIYSVATLVGTFCYLNGYFSIALLLTITVTQLWRILSETMRADFRGFGKISAYQKMGLVGVIYIVLVVTIIPKITDITPSIVLGLNILWNPSVILTLQALWIVFFIFFGKSSITTSTLEFTLIKKNI